MESDSVNKYIISRNPPSLSRKMASRTVEVKAVGAWVHPETFLQPPGSNAVLSAHAEEERMKQSEIEKTEKLKNFQQEVKKRVQKLDALKRQQQLENSYKAIENERNIIKQSAFAAEKSTSRKNRCTIRTNENCLSIRQTSAHKNRGKIKGIADEHENDKQFEQQSSQVHQYTCAAKNKLMSRRVLVDSYGRDNLPGGAWNEQNSDKEMSEERLNGTEEKETEENKDESSERSVQFNMDQLVQEIRRVKSKRPRSAGRRSASARSTGSHVSSGVPAIYPGVEDQEEKQQSMQQRAMYRRLFMDIEREQVRETQRRKEHQKKIQQLKKDKEEERKKIEAASLKLVDPSESLLGQTSRETLEKEMIEVELHESRQQQRKQIQKSVETNRFLEALKQTLREKISQRNIELPALCCCGESIWDTNPDTCANNCVFYRNPKAYAKALQCVLASCDAV